MHANRPIDDDDDDNSDDDDDDDDDKHGDRRLLLASLSPNTLLACFSRLLFLLQSPRSARRRWSVSWPEESTISIHDAAAAAAAAIDTAAAHCYY